MAVNRIYVTKRNEHAVEALRLFNMLKNDEAISGLTNLTVLNRYDVEGLTEEQLNKTLHTVFSEPMVDDIYLETYPFGSSKYFSVEYLPGQYDQRSDSAEQCVKVMTGAEKVTVRCAKTYVLEGSISDDDVKKVISILVNTIDQRIAAEAKPVILEPIMIIDVYAPEQYVGAIVGDLNSRRGRVTNVEPQTAGQHISASVPMAEILKYAPDLRSMTGGHGMFTMEFSHYEELPTHLATKLINEKND